MYEHASKPSVVVFDKHVSWSCLAARQARAEALSGSWLPVLLQWLPGSPTIALLTVPGQQQPPQLEQGTSGLWAPGLSMEYRIAGKSVSSQWGGDA